MRGSLDVGFWPAYPGSSIVHIANPVLIVSPTSAIGG
jgi:hypothetical protein